MVSFPIKQEGYLGENRATREDVQRLEEAWKSKHCNSTDFLHARDGDHLLAPYECPICVFRKLKQSNPVSINPQDTLLMECIKRAILDAFWSRASGTVKEYARKAHMMMFFF